MQTESLKQKYASYFKIGAAINPRHIDSCGELLTMHFNSITCDNAMKYSSLTRKPGEFFTEPADKVVAFAKENGMDLHGHALVWHNQTPEFIFDNTTPEGLLATLREHVQRVKSHFGEFPSFDAVNEAVEDKTDAFLRDTKWKRILGEDYIPQVFRVIKEELPNTKLFYNDYNEFVPEKRNKIVRVLQLLQAEGLVDGMGMQFHCNVFFPSLDNIKRAVEQYASLGLSIRISEFDVSLYQSDDEKQFPTPDAERLKLQADFYEQCFKVFREYHQYIDAVTLWGVADDATWLSNFPVVGRKNWPLLFDDNHEPKEAFYRIMDF